jgi:hypothetical protein
LALLGSLALPPPPLPPLPPQPFLPLPPPRLPAEEFLYLNPPPEAFLADFTRSTVAVDSLSAVSLVGFKS